MMEGGGREGEAFPPTLLSKEKAAMKIIINRMANSDDDGRTLDMTPDGEFRTPPPMPWSARILRYA